MHFPPPPTAWRHVVPIPTFPSAGTFKTRCENSLWNTNVPWEYPLPSGGIYYGYYSKASNMQPRKPAQVFLKSDASAEPLLNFLTPPFFGTFLWRSQQLCGNPQQHIAGTSRKSLLFPGTRCGVFGNSLQRFQRTSCGASWDVAPPWTLTGYLRGNAFRMPLEIRSSYHNGTCLSQWNQGHSFRTRLVCSVSISLLKFLENTFYFV